MACWQHDITARSARPTRTDQTKAVVPVQIHGLAVRLFRDLASLATP
jgi:hypothetical protein